MQDTAFVGSRWAIVALFGCLLPCCASENDPQGEASASAALGGAPARGTGGGLSTAGAGGSSEWGAGGGTAASGGPSGGDTANGGSAGKTTLPAGSTGGSSAGSGADAGSTGAACTPTDLAKLLDTTDAGASIMLSCLIGPCLLDVVGHVGPCMSQCLQKDTGMAPRCGDCVGRELEVARDACLAQCADDFACYGDCALSSLGTAGADCAL